MFSKAPATVLHCRRTPGACFPGHGGMEYDEDRPGHYQYQYEGVTSECNNLQSDC